MTSVFCVTPSTRITSFNAAGVAVSRWTMGPTDDEGRVLSWVPEGNLATLGAATGFRRAWSHRGFRKTLSMQWSVGLTVDREDWNGTDWISAGLMTTAQAHCDILDAGFKTSVLVEPFLGTTVESFMAMSSEEGPRLQDTKGMVHRNLALVLSSTTPSVSVSIADIMGAGFGLGPFGTDPFGGSAPHGWGISEWGIYLWGD